MTVACTLMFLVFSAEPPSAERGYTSLTTRAFAPGQFPRTVVNEAWRRWGLIEKPVDFPARFRERYGLALAPYPNDNLPMGLRPSPMPFGTPGVCLDCMTCHGGSLMGQSIVGLGNTALDLQALFEELSGRFVDRVKPPYTMCNTRGTNEAGATSVYLSGFRDTSLNLTFTWRNLGLNDSMCEDVPAWWLLKRKKWMYATAEADSRSVRSIMQFMMHPLNGPGRFSEEETTFADIRAYILSVKSPPFPRDINKAMAEQGSKVYETSCFKCHGGPGENSPYPGKVIPLETVGTDTTRYLGISQEFGNFYNSSWFSNESTDAANPGLKARRTGGYQAPPLDGIWATAPYLHNGSVPTLWHLLRSDKRPTRFTRSYNTDADAYDWEKVGWKTRDVDAETANRAEAHEKRKVYDTTLKGRGNSGHLFGDHLSDSEVLDLIEYLKTF